MTCFILQNHLRLLFVAAAVVFCVCKPSVFGGGGNQRDPLYVTGVLPVSVSLAEGRTVTLHARTNRPISAEFDENRENQPSVLAVRANLVSEPRTTLALFNPASNGRVHLASAIGGPPRDYISWYSSDSGVASVFYSSGADASLQAVSPGVATITAESDGRSAAMTVTVTPVLAHSFTVSPDSLSVVVGETGYCSPVIKDQANYVLRRRNIVWTSSDTTVATVTWKPPTEYLSTDWIGWIVGKNSGTTVISGTLNGLDGLTESSGQLTATAHITVH